MARKRTKPPNNKSPIKSRQATLKGFQRFSCKHYKLVASKYPFLQAVQIRSRVKKLWNKLPRNKKDDYTHSPQKIHSPSPKKFSIRCKLSPDLYYWSPTTKAHNTQQTDKADLPPAPTHGHSERPLKTSWKAYLDTSHRSLHDVSTNGDGHESEDHSLHNGKQTGILITKSEDQHKKPKAKKVSFQLFPKKELFATDGPPSDISLSLNEASKQNILYTNTKSYMESNDNIQPCANLNDSKQSCEDLNNNKQLCAADANLQYLDASALNAGVSAEICVGGDTADVGKEAGVLLQDEIPDKVAICRETGEAVMPTADGFVVMADTEGGGGEDGGGGGGGGEDGGGGGGGGGGTKDGDMSQEDVIHLVGDGIEHQTVDVTKGCSISTGIDSHLGGGIGDDSGPVMSQGVVASESAVGQQDVSNTLVVISSDITDMEIELPLVTCEDHSEATTAEDNTHLGETIELPDTSSPSAAPDNESAVVAEILAELGVIIARDISPRGRQGRSFQQQQDNSKTNVNLVSYIVEDVSLESKNSQDISIESNISQDVSLVSIISQDVSQESNIASDVKRSEDMVEATVSPEDSSKGKGMPDEIETNSTDNLTEPKEQIPITGSHEYGTPNVNTVEDSASCQANPTISLDDSQSQTPCKDSQVLQSGPIKQKRGRPKKNKADILPQQQECDSQSIPDENTSMDNQSKRINLQSPRNDTSSLEEKESNTMTLRRSARNQACVSVNSAANEYRNSTNASNQSSGTSRRRSPRNHPSSLTTVKSGNQDASSGTPRRSPRNHASSFSTDVLTDPELTDDTDSDSYCVASEPRKKKVSQNGSSPPNNGESVDPKFKVFEFDEELQVHPGISFSSPKSRYTTPILSSAIVPRCLSSAESTALSETLVEDHIAPQSTPSPGWIDSTAKRLVEKGMLSKEYEEAKRKMANEEYDLDSDRNASTFAKDVVKRQGTKRSRPRKPSPVKYVRTKKQDMFRKKSSLVKQPKKRKSSPQKQKSVLKRKTRSGNRTLKGQAKSTPKQNADSRYNLVFKTSTPQEQEDELMQAIMGISGDVDVETSLIPECLQDDLLFDVNDDLVDEDTSLPPVSTVNDTSDEWMYYNHGNPELESSDDSGDDLFSPRRKRGGAIRGPIPFTASQSVCDGFADFCAKLSQESSQLSSSQSLIDEESEALESSLNAVTVSSLYGMVEDSEGGCTSSLDLSCPDSAERPYVESAALSAIRDVFTTSMGRLNDYQDVDEEVAEYTNIDQEDSTIEGMQQFDFTAEELTTKLKTYCLQGIGTDDMDGVGDDTLKDDRLEDGEKENDGHEDREMGDIIEEALKLSGISENSECDAMTSDDRRLPTDDDNLLRNILQDDSEDADCNPTCQQDDLSVCASKEIAGHDGSSLCPMTTTTQDYDDLPGEVVAGVVEDRSVSELVKNCPQDELKEDGCVGDLDNDGVDQSALSSTKQDDAMDEVRDNLGEDESASAKSSAECLHDALLAVDGNSESDVIGKDDPVGMIVEDCSNEVIEKGESKVKCSPMTTEDDTGKDDPVVAMTTEDLNDIIKEGESDINSVSMTREDCLQDIVPVNAEVESYVGEDDPVVMTTDDFQQQAISPNIGDNLLCNMFNAVSPSPPRVNHLPTPRTSGRRLLSSNRVETDNNFGHFRHGDEDGIFL